MEQTNILLESGTNELEILEFQVGENIYGINVAKVVEISQARETTDIPNASELANEVFVLRGEVISVINLFNVLNIKQEENQKTMFITCNFNSMTTAFRVGRVHSIRRISWTDIKKPPKMSGGQQGIGLMTGVVQTDDKLILILDFERIVAMINQNDSLNDEGVEKFKESNDFGDKLIVIADDSAFLNKLVVKALNDAGFRNVKSFENGQDVWDYVRTTNENIACIVSDIEMPQMDGLALTKNIKSGEYKHIPVLLFSSLINEQMKHKCQSVGADGQFSKPEVTDLIAEVLNILKK